MESGTSIMQGIIEAVRKYTPPYRYRTDLYRDLIRVLETQGWDKQRECVGVDPHFDEALRHLHPEWADLPKPRYNEARSELIPGGGTQRLLSAGGMYYAKEGSYSYRAGYYQDRNDDKAPVFLALVFGANEIELDSKAAPKFITFQETRVPLRDFFRWDTKEVFSYEDFHTQFKETPVATPTRRLMPRHLAQPFYERLNGSVEHMSILMAENQDLIPVMDDTQVLPPTATPEEVMQLLWGDTTAWVSTLTLIEAKSKEALANRPTAEQRRADIVRSEALREARERIAEHRGKEHDLVWDAFQQAALLCQELKVESPDLDLLRLAVLQPEDGADTFLARFEAKAGRFDIEAGRETLSQILRKLHDDIQALGPVPPLES